MVSRHERATLLHIAEELRCYILSFLPYNQVLRCALICRTMYITVKNSVDLQYAIELGAQGLVQVHPATVSTGECLRILREKANAWSSFKLEVTKSLHFDWLPNSLSITHRQLGLAAHSAEVKCDLIDTTACTSKTANDPPCTWRKDDPAPGVSPRNHYVDETHDLWVSVDSLETRPRRNSRFQINFRQLSTGKEHLLASGSQLVTVTRAPSKRLSSRVRVYRRAFIDVLGDRLALYGEAVVKDGYGYWSLHVWNWHESVQADDICVVGEGYHGFAEIRFLTKEKLLAFTRDGEIELYDVEDLSKAPRLQARFILPYSHHLYEIQYPPVLHSASSCAHLATPNNHWIWTTNPADRVLCLSSPGSDPLIVITARLFFMNIPSSWFDATSGDGLSVPWSSWGPQNSRLFSGRIRGAGGSRVISFARQDYYDDEDPTILVQMMDFNPSAVARGIGKVVREATTYHPFHKDDMSVTTYLPYVEVVSSRVLHDRPLAFALDEEQVALLEQSDDLLGARVKIIGPQSTSP
ncbi:hypothetical protein DFJ58DRAFT_856105 [Suillus subalutaceus]|uniref:uncharacterized protein n=1 Tax=Suillus subalutaceus TaxID=48586 RepID=UPI001B86B7B8|nr:uncharacterized protein DFJ58DRAFT_856105 [Suillus subalutaceus]KAG1841913.1 hypothetical protein DFJ58DRAFT_856105 [Suillus subalutaceus]